MSTPPTLSRWLRNIFSSSNSATDDYSNRRVPQHVSWSYWSIMLPLTGGGTAGFWLAFGPSLVTAYGMTNTMIGFAYGVVAQTVLGYVLVQAAARTRLSSDLSTRGLGFGYLGSTITALIFSIIFFFYWALESQILGSGLAEFIGIPEKLGWIIIGALTIPLTLYGMVFVTKFQNWTMPIFAIWLIWNLVVVLENPSGDATSDFWTYAPPGADTSWLGLLGVVAAVNGSVAVVPLLSMEFARFARPSDAPTRRRLGYLGIAVIPQNVFPWLIYAPIGVLIWRATGDTNPGLAFVQLTGWVGFIGLFVTQIRINLQNTYAESMALSTLCARIFKVTPGRAFWSLVTCVAGTALIFVHVLDYINQVLALMAVLLFVWIGVIVSDLVCVRLLLNLGVGPVEHRRSYLRRFNPVGLSSFATGATVGLVLHYGPAALQLTSPGWTAVSGLASFIGFAVAFAVHPLIASVAVKRSIRTGSIASASYLVRTAELVPAADLNAAGEVACARCSLSAEASDVSRCPVAGFGWICSECCSADRSCHTVCQDPETVFPTLAIRATNQTPTS